MRRRKSRLYRSTRNTFAFLALIVIYAIINLITMIPTELFIWIGGVTLICFCIWTAIKFISKPEKYVNDRGYVVLTRENELEHRFLAKKIIGRELFNNEVVHHINGVRTDNDIDNLCLMDREKHEHFHSWLKWKKEKSGRYPSFDQQKRTLEKEYGGILLETYRAPIESRNDSVLDDKFETGYLDNRDINKKQKTSEYLYQELKNVRRMIAEEKNIPVYMVFNNKTLKQMSEKMPENEAELIKIQGVGEYKVKVYGSRVIDVIKKFKKTNKIQIKEESA